MRYFAFSVLVTLGLGLSQTAAFAQSVTEPQTELTALSSGLFLEIIPEKFVTVYEETPAEYLDRYDWVTIPATFENVTKTIVVQEAYSTLKLTPAEISADGALLTKATASVEIVPAVTKTSSRRVVKTPARRVWRKIPNTYHPSTLRKRVSDQIYIIRNESGAEVKRYEDPTGLADFVNGL